MSMLTSIHQTASIDEAIKAFESLSNSDLAKLKSIAKLRSAGLISIEWSDLLNEAVMRTLSGARVWPLNIPFIAFLAQTMRSIASEEWQRFKRENTILECDISLKNEEDSFNVENHSVNTIDPERDALAKNAIENLEKIFQDDIEALSILHGLAEGNSPDEIQVEFGLNKTQYASAQRRIRRKIIQLTLEEKE